MVPGSIGIELEAISKWLKQMQHALNTNNNLQYKYAYAMMQHHLNNLA